MRALHTEKHFLNLVTLSQIRTVFTLLRQIWHQKEFFWCQIIQKSVITIQILFDLTRLGIDFSVCAPGTGRPNPNFFIESAWAAIPKWHTRTSYKTVSVLLSLSPSLIFSFHFFPSLERILLLFCSGYFYLVVIKQQ